jgi:hypothetical protein
LVVVTVGDTTTLSVRDFTPGSAIQPRTVEPRLLKRIHAFHH